MSHTITNIEYRAVIKFLTREGHKSPEIKQLLDEVYGDASPSNATVKRWVKMFSMGRESLEDEHRSGRRASVVTEETIALVEEEVMNDKHLKVKEISARLDLSITTVVRILHEHLHLNKFSAKWVPKSLSSVQKQQRIDCATKFLELCKDNQTEFLESIVTGDETMIFYYNSLSNTESTHPDEDPLQNIKVCQSTKKIMATIFWDCEGILLINFKKHDTTDECYADLLRQLCSSIKKKRQGKFSKGVRLLHDNAPVHTTRVVKTAIKDCGFIELCHPSYSPDLSPSDYYLFPKLKSSLRRRQFQNDEELKSAVLEHFNNKDKQYFSTGIGMLISRYEKCIITKGDKERLLL